jgi:hypothetical protein
MFHRSRLFKRSRKDGTSKYKGVAFNKASNKRHAKVIIDGKNHHIGVYDNEEEAAINMLVRYRNTREGSLLCKWGGDIALILV